MSTYTIRKTASQSGIWYRGRITIYDAEMTCIDQTTSCHERLSRKEALADAAVMESHYRHFALLEA